MFASFSRFSCITMFFLLIIVSVVLPLSKIIWCFRKNNGNFVCSFVFETIHAFLVIICLCLFICNWEIVYFFLINVEKQLLQLRQLKLNKLRKYLRLIEILVYVLHIKFRQTLSPNQMQLKIKCLFIKQLD